MVRLVYADETNFAEARRRSGTSILLVYFALGHGLPDEVPHEFYSRLLDYVA